MRKDMSWAVLSHSQWEVEDDIWAAYAWVQQVTGRHRTTIMRWHRDGYCPPEVIRLARLELHGQLGLIDPKWQGWTLTHGHLHAPADVLQARWQPNDLIGAYWRTELSNLRIKRLEQEVQALRPLPPPREPKQLALALELTKPIGSNAWIRERAEARAARNRETFLQRIA